MRSVLVNKCYSCHGSSAKGGLRLDSREAAL
ncbi:c-type cytochrome domain-containing protein [Granulicella arctica]